jgi:hypothetical protein
MNEKKNNEKINLSELINKADAQDNQPVDDFEDYDDNVFDEDYDEGMGMVLERKQKEEEYNPLDSSKINPNTMNNINNYMANLEKEIEFYEDAFGEDMTKAINHVYGGEELEEEVDENVEVEDDDDLVDRETDENSFRDRYEEAIVIIDKTGMGSVVNFSPEEQAKLERAKKIKLEEVEVVELPTVKTKRAKKGSAKKILNKINNTRSTSVVLPVSGLTMNLGGCSTYELLTLLTNDRENPVESQRNKWSLLYSKVLDTSIGKLTFDEFLNNVAQMEYEVLVYGVLCATYPEDDNFPLNCPKCKTRFTHNYQVRSLLRAEEISEKMMEAIQHTVDCSYTQEDAKRCHEECLLNNVETIKLPQSGYLFTLGVQSAQEFIETSLEAIIDLDEKYNQSAILASAVKAVYVQDPDDGEYYVLEDQMDIIETIFSLFDRDLLVLGQKIGKLVEGMSYSFGLMDITCSNPRCRQHTNTVAVELEDILFHKYQQVMNTNIE